MHREFLKSIPPDDMRFILEGYLADGAGPYIKVKNVVNFVEGKGTATILRQSGGISKEKGATDSVTP